MHTRRLASFLATACWLVACANGGDPSADDGDPGGGGDAGHSALEASVPGHDAGTHTGNADTGTATPEASSGDDASDPADTSTVKEASSTQEASTAPDTGTSTPESGTTTPDTGTTSGGICGSSGIYALEAAAEVASGTLTFCFSGVCGAGQCCYEELSPGNVCVKQ